MAKKKASAKKSNVKKVAKKTVSKKPVTKSAKKVSAKAKKPSKAPAKKAVAKKTVTKSKVTAKAPAKKAAQVKKSAPVKNAPAAKPNVKPAAAPKATKIMDLSDFVTPLDDRLIIQTADTERVTAGGLYIPDTVADVSGNLHGFVVAVGRGHQNKKGHVMPMDVKVGDKVVFAQFAGTQITIQNQDLIILREGDVLGVVSK